MTPQDIRQKIEDAIRLRKARLRFLYSSREGETILWARPVDLDRDVVLLDWGPHLSLSHILEARTEQEIHSSPQARRHDPSRFAHLVYLSTHHDH